MILDFSQVPRKYILISHKVGDVDNNLNRADAVLSKANPQDLDLLVLPELAFSGEFRDAQPTPRSCRGQCNLNPTSHLFPRLSYFMKFKSLDKSHTGT